MLYSQDGLKLTEEFENCKLAAYQDQHQVWTIGYGHTRGVAKGLTCTQKQAEQWLMEDVGFAEAAVNSLVKVTLTQNEFDALVDFVFNVGVSAFQGSSMLVLLNAGRYQDAAREFDEWDKVSGFTCAGLLRRRDSEDRLFESN